MTANFYEGSARALSASEGCTAAPERGVRNNGPQGHFAQGVWGRDGPQQADRGHTIIACYTNHHVMIIPVIITIF